MKHFRYKGRYGIRALRHLKEELVLAIENQFWLLNPQHMHEGYTVQGRRNRSGRSGNCWIKVS